MNDHVRHDDLVLHYYGEAGTDGTRIVAHLDNCGRCREELAALQDTLALVDHAAEGEPPPNFEATVWARLQDHVAHRPSWWRRPFDDGPIRWAMAGTLAAVLIGAFMAGWLAREVVAPPAVPAAGASAGPMRTRVLVVAVGDHLERSQMMLSELMNAGGVTGEALSSDRLRASDLVVANRLFRQSAEFAGDESIDAVLEDLERVLVEIANAPADLTAGEFDALRERIDRRGLVFRVRVLSDELRARQQAEPVTETKGRTS